MLIAMRFLIFHVVLTTVYGDGISDVAKSYKPEYTSGGVGSYSRGGLYAQSAVTTNHAQETGIYWQGHRASLPLLSGSASFQQPY